MRNITALILGGGRGARLYPLTLERSKPAVSVAGKYRLIDITVSNCINSGIKRVFVITQFLSASLHRHIMQTYRFDAFTDGAVEILAAEQTPQRETWYQGTADAVRESLRHVLPFRSEAVLILSGDHLYRMDYTDMIRRHLETESHITLAVQPVPRVEAPRMGLLRVGPDGDVREFLEKPKDPAVLERFRAPEHLLPPGTRGEPMYLGSMGIYVFHPGVLTEMLADDSRLDFGKEVLPAALGTHRVQAYPFTGHWEDIGTIRSYFDAHMGMVQPSPAFPLHDPGWPIYTRQRNLPPARVIESEIRNSLLCEGVNIQGATIRDSVIGVRALIRPGARLDHVVMAGSDYYEGEESLRRASPSPAGAPPMGIGEGAVIERAIIDKNARIGAGVVITRQADGIDREGENWWVREGIVVIPKGAVLAPGTRI